MWPARRFRSKASKFIIEWPEAAKYTGNIRTRSLRWPPARETIETRPLHFLRLFNADSSRFLRDRGRSRVNRRCFSWSEFQLDKPRVHVRNVSWVCCYKVISSNSRVFLFECLASCRVSGVAVMDLMRLIKLLLKRTYIFCEILWKKLNQSESLGIFYRGTIVESLLWFGVKWTMEFL